MSFDLGGWGSVRGGAGETFRGAKGIPRNKRWKKGGGKGSMIKKKEGGLTQLEGTHLMGMEEMRRVYPSYGEKKEWPDN